jgi:malate dehydrogenase (oxaloacetate-decarboxylating)
MSIITKKHGRELLQDPLLNKGLAFSEEEKNELHLIGLLPAKTETLQQQITRMYEDYQNLPTLLDKHIFLRSIQDENEVLFYRLILEHLVEMVPIIYTPVVGAACERFSHIYREPRGLFISYPEKDKLNSIFQHLADSREIKVIVVTDGERILGLGDQGAGGLGIPIGKLSLYTSCGGIHPKHTLPIVLDVGTNNQTKLADPEYIGWRNPRLTGDEYYQFVDHFIQCVKRHLPNVLLQFEDFAQQHAAPLLKKYHDQLCCFNDDIQGTAAVVVSAIIAATHVANVNLHEQRIALLGAGSAGCGICEQIVQYMIETGMDEKEARSRFYLVDRAGLLTKNTQNTLPFQEPFKRDVPKDWTYEQPGTISLMDVIKNAKPTILVGVSTQGGAFNEKIVREMTSYCKRPIIFPLSNPTDHAEAIPADLLAWTSGTALIATGSPFDSVKINGQTIDIAQCNNVYIFPGVGLAVIAGNIRRVTPKMMMAAALALSELAPAMKTGVGRLLPEIKDIRHVCQHIAKACYIQACKEGHADKVSPEEIDKIIKNTVWDPHYETMCLKKNK